MIKNISWISIFKYSSLALAVVFLSYFCWFYLYLGRGISESPEQWGQFGDFLGGVLNPILSFITICILVKTAFSQVDEIKRRESREDRSRFEERLYGVISYQRQSFNDFCIKNNFGIELYRGMAVKYIEDLLFSSSDIKSLSDPNIKDEVFSLVRQFYLIVKMIDDEVINGDIYNERDKAFYYNILISLTDFNLIRMIFFGSICYDSWANSKYIMSNKDLLELIGGLGMSKYIESVKDHLQKK